MGLGQMGLFDSLRGMAGNLEAQAAAGDEGAKTALGLGAALKGALGDLGQAAQRSVVEGAASRQRQAAARAQADAVSAACAALGLSTDGGGNLTLASKRKVFNTLVEASEFYQDHDFRFTKPIGIRTLSGQYPKATFTIGNLRLAGGEDVSARNAALFRDFLDSAHIRYRERTARNIFELAKGEEGSTYVFEVRPDTDVPGQWHVLSGIDLKEAAHKLLTMLSELR
jgi:hypothetical protein